MRDSLSAFQVLLSYGRPDVAVVHSVWKTLREARVSAWMDIENIRAGEDWRPAIKAAMKVSQLVVVFLSKRVVAREGYLQAEIVDALDMQRTKPPGSIFIVPVRLDDCELHPRLEQFHCISLSTKEGIDALVQQILDARVSWLRSTAA
jgi:hypothetical protein